MYASPISPSGRSVCRSPRVAYEPRTRTPDPEGPVGPTGPIGPRGVGGRVVASEIAVAELSSRLRSTGDPSPTGIKIKNFCGFTP